MLLDSGEATNKVLTSIQFSIPRWHSQPQIAYIYIRVESCSRAIINHWTSLAKYPCALESHPFGELETPTKHPGKPFWKYMFPVSHECILIRSKDHIIRNIHIHININININVRLFPMVPSTFLGSIWVMI